MNQNKRLLFLFSVIICLVLTIFGVSIAFFSYAKEGTTESTVKLGGITFKYTENGDSGNGIDITDSFPISDEEGKKLSGAGNVFEFKVESNLSRSDLEYEITVEATKESELPLDAIKFYLVELDGENEKEIESTLNSDGIVKTLADFSDTNIVEQTGKNVYQETILKNTKGYVKKFRVRMWISEDVDWADDNYANKSGQLRVNVYANSDRTTASTDTTTPDDVRIERVTANNKYLFTKVDSEVYQYELTVPNEVSVLDINVIPTNMSAVSSVTNMDNLEEFGLNVGENYFRAVVTSSNGKKKKEYILKVVREKSNNTGLNKLEVEDYSLVPSYSDGNDEYTVTVPYDKTSIIVSAEKKEQIQEITGLGTYNLTVGANDISVKVTAEDGTVRVIRINVIRSKSTDASIKNVKVEGYSLTYVEGNIYSVTIPNEVNSVEIKNVSETGATVDNIGIKSGLKVGNNDYEVIVTSQDGSNVIKYIIRVIRLADSDNTLKSLSLSSCTLSPTFASGTTSYTCTVENSVTSTMVTAEATSSVATVSGTGSQVLTVGENKIDVVVTSESGSVKTYTVTVTRKANSDATLKSLTVSSGTLSPAFNKDVLIYTLEVPYSVDNITIIGEANVNTSNVEGLGSKNLIVGENSFDIVVTAEDKTTKTYNITVIRKEDSDTSLKNIGVKGYDIVKVDDNNYTLTVENNVTSVEIVAEALSSVASISGTGVKSLTVGENKFGVILTAQNGDISTYNVVITRKASSDATLKGLTVSSGTLSPTFASGTTSYTLTVPYSVTSLTVTPTVNNSEAKTSVTGNTSLTVGSNTVSIVVTAGDGTKKTYTITVTRSKDTTNTLKSLSLSNCTLSPTFASGTTSYTCTVENSVTSTTVTATATSSVATVSGTGSKSLSVGSNTVSIVVTSQSGAKKTYTVTVTRKASSDATLKGLTVSSGTLSPTFASGTTSYTLTVPYSVTSLTVTPTVNNSEAKTSVTGNTSLIVGSNTVSIVVTAGDGTKKTYTITVTRSKDTTNTLKSLAVSGYSLTPTFASGTTEYTLTLEASSITVTAAATSSVATVSGTGSKSLNWGTNTISVIVTSQSGSIKTYKITVDNQRPTAPVLQGGSDSWVSTAPTISIKTAGGAISGVKNYEYYKSTSNTAPTDTTTATGTTTGSLTVSDEGTSYVWYRTVSNNGFKSSWTSSSQVIKLDTIKPTATAITYNGGSNSCIWKNNYNLTLSSSAASGISHYEIDVDSNGTADLTTSSNFIPVNNWSTCKARFRAVSNSGLVGDWTAEQHIHMDTESPKFTNWWWGEVTKDVARLYVQATDNVGLQSPAGAYNNHNSGVFCPTSTASGGYGNWTWFAATWDATANAYRCDITPATFGHYGQTYTTHLYIYDYAGNGGYYNATTVNIPASCSYANGSIWEFNYTGGIQTFTAPCSGTYKLEVYGAQGGNQLSTGGLGGYSYGNVSLATSQSIYVGVGGAGSYSHGSSYTGSAAGGYNGGGSGVRVDKDEDGDYQDAGGGGGATHIATTNRGILANYNSYRSEVLIVAGGGGGGANASSAGGTGGGVNGGAGVTNVGWYAYGGTQTSGGANSGNNYSPTTASSFGTGSSGIIGGGGGWFGGGSAGGSYGFADATGKYSTAGGGSGYIGGVSGGSMQNGVRAGNGYAKITLVASN